LYTGTGICADTDEVETRPLVARRRGSTCRKDEYAVDTGSTEGDAINVDPDFRKQRTTLLVQVEAGARISRVVLRPTTTRRSKSCQRDGERICNDSEDEWWKR
jgi:hypothetical protein